MDGYSLKTKLKHRIPACNNNNKQQKKIQQNPPHKITQTKTKQNKIKK